MQGFRLEAEAVAALRGRAAARVDEAPALLARARAGAALDDEALVALFLAPAVRTADLVAVAEGRRPAGGPRLETFAPLYLTNECDAECRMCGMRGTNAGLVRETADGATVAAQLDILHRRGLRGVALLTGEYRPGPRRRTMIARTAAALRAALTRGFTHVLVNIGALDAPEYDVLLADVPRDGAGRVVPRLTMCTFQETYSPAAYARAMGTNAANPRSDFGRRPTNFDRACDAGMWVANPGVLLGLNPDVGFELAALLAHVRHLAARGMEVYVSLPRLRKATGTARRRGDGDETLTRLVAVLSFGVPEAKVVISTREPPAVQRRLLPMIGVLTPGSPGVAPYTETGARFELEASQFEVLDHRPIEVILGEYLTAGATIERFEGGAAPARA
jgi:3-methyl-2-indolic acid synthase